MTMSEINGQSQQQTTSSNTLERDFSKVILTLDNVLVPDEKLQPTPSSLDGLDLETETDLRILGCELIQTSGTLLKLPQVAMACGQVLFQRFYYSKSFVKHDCETVAMACINLAGKIEESPRRMRDVINVFHHIRQVRNGKNIGPLILDQNYIALKNKVIKAERRILKELGFCVHVKHPHKIIVTYLQVLESETNSRLVQQAWNYMNDSFRTDVFLRYAPETIACACIHLAARQLQIPMPSQPPWYKIFLADVDEVHAICITILKLYNRPKISMEELDKRVNDVKRLQQESKRHKGLSSDVGTPNSNSRNVSPKPLSPAVKKVSKDADDRSDHSGHDRPSRRRSRSPLLPRKYQGRSSSHSLSRSRSRSLTPPPPKRSRAQHSPNPRKRKDRNDRERNRHKRRRSFSRSVSPRSPNPSPRRKSKKGKMRYRSRSRSFSPEQRMEKKRVDKYRR